MAGLYDLARARRRPTMAAAPGPYDSSGIGGERGGGMRRGLGLGLGLGAGKRAGFRQAVNSGGLDDYLGARPGLQRRFDARLAGGGARGSMAQNFQQVSGMNQKALGAVSPVHGVAPNPVPPLRPAPDMDLQRPVTWDSPEEAERAFAGGTPDFDESGVAPGLGGTLPAGGTSPPARLNPMLAMLLARLQGGGAPPAPPKMGPRPVTPPDWSQAY